MRRPLYGFSLTCVMTREGGKGENDSHCNPLRSPGTPLVGLNRESMESTLTHLRLTLGGRLLEDFPQSKYSLRGRRSKGKGKGIRMRDHARGRRFSPQKWNLRHFYELIRNTRYHKKTQRH